MDTLTLAPDARPPPATVLLHPPVARLGAGQAPACGHLAGGGDDQVAAGAVHRVVVAEDHPVAGAECPDDQAVQVLPLPILPIPPAVPADQAPLMVDQEVALVRVHLQPGGVRPVR